MRFFTYEDGVQHLADYLGGAGAGDAVLRDIRRALWEAYLDLGNCHNWSYLYRLGRVITTIPQAAGTVSYDHAGGTYDRMLTLDPGDTGAVWPSWAALGFVRVGTVNYKVARRVSDTVVTLDDILNPGADLAAGTGYTLYQDTYLLPEDFASQDQALYERNFGGMAYTHPREWVYENRYVFAQGVPQCFTVIGDSRLPGRMTFRCFPFPTDTKTIDFVYKRRPRALSLYRYSSGTASVSANGTSVTGAGTSFTSSMVGSVLRLSSGATSPTSVTGSNPAAHESAILSVTDATHLELYDPAPADLSGVALTVSDPADIDLPVMLNAYLRNCERHVAMSRTLKDKPSAAMQYREALAEAKAADSRCFAGRYEGQITKFRQRLRDMPVGADEP